MVSSLVHVAATLHVIQPMTIASWKPAPAIPRSVAGADSVTKAMPATQHEAASIEVKNLGTGGREGGERRGEERE